MLEGPPQMPAAIADGPPSRTGSGGSMRNRANTVGYDRSPTRQTMRNSVDVPRAASPQPPVQAYNPNSVSPRPQPVHPDGRYSNSPQPMQHDPRRSVSPNPYARPGTANTYKRASTAGIEYYQQQTQQQQRRTPSPNPMMNQDRGSTNSPATYRPYSPNPQAIAQHQQPQQPVPIHPQQQGYHQQQPPMQRPRSQHSGSFGQMDAQSGAIESYNPRRGRQSYYDASGQGYGVGAPQQSMAVARPRSKSVVDVNRGQFSRDGRPILYYGMYLLPCVLICHVEKNQNTDYSDAARAMYGYQAAIPEELSFQKGDVMAVLRQQDDGWWEAEVMNQLGGSGLVPSNYLQQM